MLDPHINVILEKLHPLMQESKQHLDFLHPLMQLHPNTLFSEIRFYSGYIPSAMIYNTTSIQQPNTPLSSGAPHQRALMMHFGAHWALLPCFSLSVLLPLNAFDFLLVFRVFMTASWLCSRCWSHDHHRHLIRIHHCIYRTKTLYTSKSYLSN